MKKFVSLGLAIIMVVMLLPISVLNVSASGFAGGDGSRENPYQISTAQQLDAIRNDLSASYILINDIDLSGWGNWTPIGNSSQPFSGTMFGNDHTIKGLKMHYPNYTGEDAIAFFGGRNKGEISHLHFSDVDIEVSSEDYVDVTVIAHSGPWKEYCNVYNASIKTAGLALAYGNSSGYFCDFYGEITTDSTPEVNGSSTNCNFYGTINLGRGMGATVGLNHFSKNCYIKGKINFTDDFRVDMYCNSHSDNCHIDADMTAKFPELHAFIKINAYKSKNCSFNGDIDLPAATMEFNVDSENCSVTGDISTERLFYQINKNSTSCTYEGRLNYGQIDFAGDVNCYGNYQSTNCLIVTEVVNSVPRDYTSNYYANYESNSCSFIGNVTINYVKGRSFYFYESYGGSNCRYSGKVLLTDSVNEPVSNHQTLYQGGYCEHEFNLYQYRIVDNDETITLYCDRSVYDYDIGSTRLCNTLLWKKVAGYVSGNTGSGSSINQSSNITAYLRIYDIGTGRYLSGVKVSVDGKTYTTDSAGVVRITSDDYIMKNLVVYNDTETLYQSENYLVFPNSVNEISVSMNLDCVIDLSIMEEQIPITGPTVEFNNQRFPLFEFPFAFDLSTIDGASLRYDPQTNRYKLLLGTFDEDTLDMEIQPENGKIESSIDVTVEKVDEEWDDIFKKIKHICNETDSKKINTNIKDLKKLTQKANTKIGVEAEANAAGYLEFEPKNGGLSLVGGGIFAYAEADAAYSLPFPAAPYLYYVFSVSGEFSENIKFELTETNDKTYAELMGGIELVLSPELGVGAGLYDIANAELGLWGELDAKLNASNGDDRQEPLTVDISGGAYAQLQILAFCLKNKWEFVNQRLYPQNEVALLSISPEEEPVLIQRSYLNGGVSLLAADINDICSTIYPYGNVIEKELANGKSILVYTDDDVSRNLINKTALYYRIKNNGVWGNATLLDDDGTGDFDFDVSVVGDTAYVMFQDLKKPAEDTDGVADILPLIEVSCVKIEDGTITSNQMLTDNSEYEYYIKTSANSEQAAVSWVTNSSNTYFATERDNTETISKAVSTDGASFGTEKVVENITGIVYDIVMADNGDVYYISDTDKYDGTEDDRTMFLNGTSYAGGIRKLQKSDNTIYYLDNYNSMGSVDGSFRAYNIPDIGTDFRLLESENGVQAVVYKKQTGLVSDLYVRYYKYYALTEEERITDGTEMIRSWDCSLNENGEIEYVILGANVDVSSEDLDSTAHLHEGAFSQITNDVSISDCTYNGKTIYVEAFNRSDSYISYQVSVADVNGNILYQPEEYDYNYCDGGEQINYGVDFSFPEDFAGQSVIITITTDLEQDENEENNHYELNLADGNLVLSAESGSGDTGAIHVAIGNNGLSDITEAALVVTKENGECVYEKKLSNIHAQTTISEEIDVSEHLNFSEMTDYSVFNLSVHTDSDEYSYLDNQASVTLFPAEIQAITVKEPTLHIMCGNTYALEPEIMPSNSLDFYLCYSSANEGIASVDENGVISAVSQGETDITVSSLNGVRTSVHVVVDENQNANNNDIAYDDTTKTVTINSTEAYSNASVMIVLYNESGKFLGLEYQPASINQGTTAVTFEAFDSSGADSLKIIVWENADSLRPLFEADNPNV